MFSLLNMNKIACVPAMEKGLSLMVFAAAPPIVGRGPTSGDSEKVKFQLSVCFNG